MVTHSGTRHGGQHTTTSRGRTTDTGRTPWGQVLGMALGVATLIAVVITAFAWPGVNTGPRELPVAVVAPPPVAEQVSGLIAERAGEGAVEIVAVGDRAAAERAILDREVYGALVLGPQGGEVLTASAASPAVAQLLGQLAAGVPEQAGGPATVTDLVPLPPEDPRGVGLASAVLPLVIAGIAGAAVAGLRVRGTGQQVTTVLTLAVSAGVVLTLVLQTWLGAIGGGFWVVAGVLALGIAAIGTTLLGMFRLLGHAGLGLGAATMILLGNPLSGATSAPEMLPAGWGQLGQLLPPGATGTALRSVAWFEGAGSGAAFTVLAVWLVVGLGLVLVPRRTSAVASSA